MVTRAPAGRVAGWTVPIVAGLVLAFLTGLTGCHWSPSTTSAFRDPDTARRLLSIERRLAREFLPSLSDTLRPAREVIRRSSLGGDPVRVFPLPHAGSPTGFAALLRGTSEVVILDESLRVHSRLDAPVSPVAAAWLSSGVLVVGGEYDGNLFVYELGRGAGSNEAGTHAISATVRAQVAVPGLLGVSDLQIDEAARSLVLVDPWSQRVREISLESLGLEFTTNDATGFRAGASRIPLAAGPAVTATRREDAPHPLRLAVRDGVRVWTETHGRVVVLACEGDTLRFEHDGPVWSFALWSGPGDTWLAMGGVEDHPLDRGSGEFGYVDSFLFLYRVQRGGTLRADRVNVIDLSEVGVITPKRVRWTPMTGGDGVYLDVAGFGGEAWARMRLDEAAGDLDPVTTVRVPPGVSDFSSLETRLVLANPLLDTVELRTMDGTRRARASFSHVTKPAGSSGSTTLAEIDTLRLGEILFHSELMAPRNQSAGLRSRFSCEACHLEGGVDGRTHFTGRGHVHATTKPVRGLLQNIPLFSRAGDDAMAVMVLAEFRVANQDRRDVFDLDPIDHPWLPDIGFDLAVEPPALRLALLRYLSHWKVRPQPRRMAELPFPPEAVRGLAVFRDRCAHCHQAVRTLRDDLDLETEERAAPFSTWSSWLTDREADLIWGMPGLMKTGVEPYVAEAGARVPSLRRIQWKSPYFTNGSATTLRDALEAFRYRDLEAWHASGTERPVPIDARPLTALEVRDLELLLAWF